MTLSEQKTPLHHILHENIHTPATWLTQTYQVDGDGAAQQEAQIDVDGVVLVLDDPRQAADDGADDKGENQQWLQQFGRVGQGAVEVHLQTWKPDVSPHACTIAERCIIAFLHLCTKRLH